MAMKYVGKPYSEPGKSWHYSNTNYLVLGVLAETVAKEPLADQVRTRFLEPLGLDHTWYQPEDTAPSDVAHGYRFASASTAAPAIDLSDGTPLVPFTSVVTAAGGAGGGGCCVAAKPAGPAGTGATGAAGGTVPSRSPPLVTARARHSLPGR